MAAIDPIHFQPLHKYFPGLTLNQVSIGVMRAEGYSVAEISQLRNISEQAVKQTLAAVCKKMSVPSVTIMSTAIEVRIKIAQITAMENLIEALTSVSTKNDH